MGKLRALKLGITKGVERVGRATLPQTFKCPVCKYVFKAMDVAIEAKERNISPEEIVAAHIMKCIGGLRGQAQCPECGKMVKGKDFEAHMNKNHPIHRETECPL